MMRKLKTISLSLLLTFLLSASIWAFDFGGSVSAAADYSPAGTFVNEEALGLWMATGKAGGLSFETKLDLIASPTGPAFYINPDYLKLDGLFTGLESGPSVMGMTIGRFSASDFSARILNQKIDGFSFSFSYPAFELSVTAGYTGFFFNETGSLLTSSPSTIMSKTDLSDRGNSTDLFGYLTNPAEKSKVLFQSPRMVEVVTFSLPQLLFKQSLTLSLVAQEDMRPLFDLWGTYGSTDAAPYTPVLLKEGEGTFDPQKGGAVDTQYLGLGISGPSIDSLYHNVFYYFGTGRAMSYKTSTSSSTGKAYSYDMIISHLAGVSLDYYMEWLFNSRVGLTVLFATGDSDASSYYEGNTAGSYDQFLPITNGGGGIIFSPGVSNILSANINLSAKPLEWLPIPLLADTQFVLNAIPFFRVVNGPLYVSGIKQDFTGNYLGSEIDLTVNMRLFSDLGIITQLGYFVPNAEAFTKADPVFMAKINVSLSF